MAVGGPKSVLITGCSSGFGLATAVAAARRGWRVFAGLRDPARGGALERATRTAGVAVEVIRLDVTDTTSVRDAVTGAVDAADGRLDAVVCNAGIGDAGFFEDMPDEHCRRVMETNFFGVLAVTRAALPTMRSHRSGRIIVVSSIGAYLAQPALSLYVASKWAVEGWAESLALEVAPFGIQVALVEPGTYRTGIWNSAAVAGAPDSPYADLRATTEARARRLADRFARDPAEVGRRITALLDAPAMPLRNPIGPDAVGASVARRVLPTRVRFGAIRRMLNLPSTTPHA